MQSIEAKHFCARKIEIKHKFRRFSAAEIMTGKVCL